MMAVTLHVPTGSPLLRNTILNAVRSKVAGQNVTGVSEDLGDDDLEITYHCPSLSREALLELFARYVDGLPDGSRLKIHDCAAGEPVARRCVVTDYFVREGLKTVRTT